VCQAVTKAVRARNEEAARHIYHFITYGDLAPDMVRRMKRSGVILPDDWALSGVQMEDNVEYVTNKGVRTAKIEIQLISARAYHLQRGISSVACRAYFSFDPTRTYEDASIAGNHGTPDYGYRNKISELYYLARVLAAQNRLE